jgi:hypothetical protein
VPELRILLRFEFVISVVLGLECLSENKNFVFLVIKKIGSHILRQQFTSYFCQLSTEIVADTVSASEH